jgi:osmotically-inducible protein OsmY
MVAVQTAQTSLSEFSRCNERPWLKVEELNGQAKQDHVDGFISEKVNHTLWNNGLLRSTAYQQIDVVVNGGVVFLSGHVISSGNQRRAEDAVLSIPGVLGVKSSLVADDTIIRDVAGELGKIEQVYGVKFYTGIQNGVIGLHGEGGSLAVRSMAEKFAVRIPGVRGVINWVRAPGFDLEAEDQRFLQPFIGDQIYFHDGLSGIVQKVIINPDNLRVAAMVVRGRYSNPQQDHKFLKYGEDQVPERLIAIPMSAVRHLTMNSGYLSINSDEAAMYSDFDPSGFTAPRKDWTPPYPYCPDDVLFPLESVENKNPTESERANVKENI